LFQANAQHARIVTINGRPGLAVGSAHGPRVVLLFVMADNRILHYDVVADPIRLAALRIEH
jgi:RNA polymerase sigma-70 factor (ECF subfamily)